MNKPRIITPSNGSRGNTQPNVPVLLGHDLTVRVDRLHDTRLKFVAARLGINSPTMAAEHLLAWAIDRYIESLTGAAIMNVLCGLVAR